MGSGAVGQSAQGYSVALSADGNTALVGGPYDDHYMGATWVFTRSNGVWTQQQEKLVGSGAVRGPEVVTFVFQGISVALSADGNTAAIGGCGDNDNAGAVWVFTRSDGVWIQQGSKLVGSGGSPTPDMSCGQGKSVALSADGNTLVEGSPVDDDTRGAAWVFTRSGGVWTQQGNKLVAQGINQLGLFTALSADGNTLAFGTQCCTNSYLANIFVRSNGLWNQEGMPLAVNGPPVSLTGDGNTLVAGTSFFHRSNGSWTEIVGALAPSSKVFGQLQFSADGSTIVEGCENCSDTQGQVALYTKTGGIWSQHNNVLVGTDSLEAAQGKSVAVSANGNTMIEGGPGISCACPVAVGAAWIFASPQLSTSLHHTGSFHHGQTGATYSITVSNVGDRDIHAAAESTVNIIDNLPSGLIATEIAGAGWSCTLATVSCTRQDGLAVGASFPPVTVTVNVASNAPTKVTNAATASGGGSNWGNAKDVTTIIP